MKNKIDRFKIKTSRFSIRSIAVVLCFVMLLTAIGSGSVLSAIAAGVNQPTVSSAIKTVIDCADQDVGNDEVALQKKGDSDLAGTGYTNAIIKKVSGGSTSNLATISLTSDAGAISVDTGMSAGETLNFYIAYSDNSGDTRASWTNNGYSLSAGEIYDCNGKSYNSSNKNYFSYTILNSGVLSFNVFESAESICVTEGYELRYGTTSGAWAFGHGQDGSVTTLAPSGTSNEYTAEITFDSATTNYFFVSDLFDDDQDSNVQNKGYYYKPSSDQTASLGTSYSLGTVYGNNYGNSGNKIAFTPTKDKAYKFTFNNSSKTLTITNASYDVSISAGSNGSISTSPATLTGLTGSQTITVTATPDTGYHPVWPAGFTSTGTNTATVTVTGAATYNVTFAKDKYNVTANAASNGSYTLSKSGSQEWGTTINVQNITPNAGYELDKITYTAGTSDPVDITTAKSFTLGKADTSVTVTFKKSTYNIAKGTVTGTGCDITIDKSTAQIGDTITVTCTPATGYKISTVQFGGANATQDGSDENKWTYTLNASNVGNKTVTATFVKEDYAITKTVSPESSGSISVKKSASEATQYNIGDTLSLSATPAEHYTFKNFTVTGATSATLTTNPATLSMSGKTGAVSITANFDKTIYKGISYSGKYSTTGEDDSYTNNLDGLLFDEAVYGTNQDGIALTAPTATGYTFYKWVSTGGTITNATSTTDAVFKPTDDNQTVTALYKKNYTVVATAGTNGDLTSTTTYPATQTVAAGDTASFEFTPDAGYGISSILVNLVDKLDRVHTDAYVFTTEAIKSDTTVQASFSPAITVNATVSNTNEARNAISANRFHYGNGKVSINSGTSSSTTTSAVVTTGSNVTFTATPDSGWGFGGWYSDATCKTLVSSQSTMTVPCDAGVTYYAAFIEDHYYLTGKFYAAHLAKETTAAYNNTTYEFTKDPNNPGIFTYTADFMFKKINDQLHYQFVSVGYGSSDIYTTGVSSDGGVNGEAATGVSNSSSCWKWTCGGETEGEVENDYSTVTFTWDAINEKLSWKYTPIDYSKYTVMKIHCGTDWTWDHLWLQGGSVLTNGRIYIPGIPSEEIGGVAYNVLLVLNSAIGDKELKYQLSTTQSGDTHTGDLGGVYAGGVYLIDAANGSTNFDPQSQDLYYLSGQYSNGSAGFFDVASATATADMKPMLSSDNRYYSWEYSATGDDTITPGVIQFKVHKNPDADDYTKATYPEYAQSYRIKSNIVKLTFTYDCSDHSITVTPTYKEQPWYYSGIAAASRTEVNPINSMTAFTASDSSTYGKIRFMGGTSDTGLNTAITPSYYKTGDTSNAYWADLTSSIGTSRSYYFGLCLQNNKGDLIGNNSEEINDDDDAEARDIQDSDGNTLFKLQFQSRNDVSSNAKYVYISAIDWSRVTAIGVKAYDNSKATCNTWSNPHNGLVDYQIYYKPVAPEEEDPVPDPDFPKLVDIYAKDATLRSDTFNRFANLADTSFDQTYFEFTDPTTNKTYTSITAYNADEANENRLIEFETNHANAYGTGAGYQVMKNVPVGAKIKIKTQLDTADNALDFGDPFAETHYLKAYSFNGATYMLHKPSDMENGLVEEVWTVRDVNTIKAVEGADPVNLMKNGKTIEITPIYYLQDNTNTRTFYIEGYDGTVQQAWGNMLSVYPYYEGKSNKENAFGGYPGQPMLLWGGKYQMEVPLTVDGSASGATVKGLTLHNGYWDLLHRDLDLIAGQQHAQTYDYDDFYKLNKEKNPDSIIFDFKYFSKATGTDNYNDGYQYTKYNFAEDTTSSVEKNAVEDFTDYYGRPVDAFGTVLTDEEAKKTALTFVSTGYKDTYVGEYATIWAVYKPDGSYLGLISSSMLYLSSLSRVSQYTDGTNTAAGRMSWEEFTDTYTALKANYTKTPIKISYDKEIWNDSKDKANRSDGRWYYSKNSDKVRANIIIQYGPATLIDKPDKSLTSAAWLIDSFDETKTGVGGEHNIGSVTGCSAYFTNTTPVNLNGKTDSGQVFSDSSKHFDFKAQSSGSYMFAGWVRKSNGKYYEISDSEIGQSNMSANDTYIARFVEAKAGTLIVSHDVEQTDVFKGTGTPSITVVVKSGDTTLETLSSNTGENLVLTKYIKTANRNYTIDITLSTDPDDVSESYMKEIISSAGNFAASPATFNTGSGTPSTATQTATVAQFKVSDILDSGVTNLRYVSHLMKPEYHYSYDITYTYNSRFYGEQSYTVSGTFDTEGGYSSAGNMTGAKTTAKLTDDFIVNQTPYEKNFREKINWNYTDVAVGRAAAMVNNAAELDPSVSNTYKMTAHVYSANTVDDSVKAEFLLPYKHLKQDGGYKADPLKEYDANENVISENEYIFDESQESVTVETQAYNLFTYADKEDADDLNLIEAAPYVWKNTTKHTVSEEKVRYFTGTYFTIGDTNYWYSAVPDKIPAEATGTNNVAVIESTVVNNWHGKNYTWSVLDSTNDTLYSFKEDGDHGQYTRHTYENTTDGFVSGKSEQKRYFTRWDIFNSDGDLVANGYSRFFNFTGYENYLIKAVYESETAGVPATVSSSTMATITYLGDTRNQWNNGNCGSYSGKAETMRASDELYADFAIAYRYNGEQIDQIDSANHVIKTGMIIERLGAVEEIGGTKMTDISYYIDKYKSDASTVTAIQNEFNNATNNDPANSALKEALNGHTAMNSKIGANVDGWGSIFGAEASDATTKMEFNSVIDNFNRLQWCYNFKNNKDGNGNVKNAKYVFRAWSYIIVDGVATVSSTPAYFTFYDTAVR